MIKTAAMRRWLIVMVKVPVMGRVKTRLARDVGAVEAARFYRCSVASLVQRVGQDPRWTTVLAISPDAEVNTPVFSHVLRRRAQGGGNLGRRMTHLMRTMPPGPVVIIGSDCPALRSHHIAQAFRLVRGYDGVIGPSPDGGYWLIGLRRSPKISNIFDNVRWSTSFARADTLRNCVSLDMAALEMLEDVDTGVEYAKLGGASGRRILPR